ncbi:MAG TPA: hypothetical protein VGD65_19375 [Chryseosolibacter sp.]
MRIFLRRTFLFLLLLSAMLFAYVQSAKYFLRKHDGPDTKAQIEQSFKNAVARDYDVLLLGNSRFYRGINPEKFSVPTYNFSHDNDSYNQVYHKLLFLEKKNKAFKTLVLGVDYFQFSFLSDSRNYAYAPFFDESYFNDFESNVNVVSEIENLRGKAKTLHIVKATTHTLLKAHPLPINLLRENGQYIAKSNEAGFGEVIREYNKIPVLENYFKKILKYAEDRKINVILLMPPAQARELSSYPDSVIAEYDRYFQSFENRVVHYLNYSRDSRFDSKDFFDFTHLSESSADKFSVLVNNDIARYLDSNEVKR